MPKYSYANERAYYERSLPNALKPYGHLGPYVTNWLDPTQYIRGKRILDLGAGECEYSRLFLNVFGAHSVTACELIPHRMLLAARANNDPGLSFVAGDGFYLPFCDTVFDAVWLSLTMHQLPSIVDILREIRRVLKPGGIYMGLEPNPFNALILYRYFWGTHSPNQYLLSPWRLKQALRATGFQPRTVSYYSGRSRLLRGPVIGTCFGIFATKSS